MPKTTKGKAPGGATPEAHALTTKAGQSLPKSKPKATPWHWPSGEAAKPAYLRACESVWLSALAWGPCSLSEARHAVNLFPPKGVDGRCAGGLARTLAKAGRIVWVRWGRSPLRSHHHGASGVWMLADGAT